MIVAELTRVVVASVLGKCGYDQVKRDQSEERVEKVNVDKLVRIGLRIKLDN